ncbi:heat shock protein [Cryptosporidium ubiquitum]|uniref:Heat shock protein n=1 Tax=Cryptosporidium ubiquitum TaxID=857276 RepID=A0A1J4MFB8_9CRYT|nr:heat shock protein [Cryptosporidium ubiquitum]OII72155.1 heat shock protein [Cryptosporidium ubiquitum]
MSVIGLDIGTINAVVATINRGAVTIVRNELSERTTPILVGYTDTERLIGEPALTKMKSNYKNTCRYMKPLLGMLPNNVTEIEKMYSLAEITTCENGNIGFKVRYKGNQQVVSLTSVYASFLKRLKENTEKSTGQSVRDLVISIPGYYDNVARQNVLDALHIAGINCLRLMNEESAVALDYGIFRSNNFAENENVIVAFISCGAGYFFVSIVRFTKGKFDILSTIYENRISGRLMDYAIMEFAARDFNQKYKTDLLKDPKARLKLEDSATKCKKILSANQEAAFVTECVDGENDISMMIERSTFEELCSNMSSYIPSMVDCAIKQAGIKVEDISSIEIIGGCSRIPWVQRAIGAAFNNKELCKTLNADETVARGCALQAAMLSPVIKVREFNMTERFAYEVLLFWQNSPGSSDFKSATLFSLGSDLNVLKNSTFSKTEPFEIALRYAPNPHSNNLDLGRYFVDLPSQQDSKVKLYIRLDRNGIVRLEKVEQIKEEVVMENVPATTPAAVNPEDLDSNVTQSADSKPEEQPAAPQPTMKTRIKRTNVQFKQIGELPGYLNEDSKTKFKDGEARMSTEDLLVHLTREKLNELESYVFDMRSKISPGGNLNQYAEKQSIEAFLGLLVQAENWIYDNYESTKEIFEKKLEELKVHGNPIEMRYQESVQLEEVRSYMNSMFEHFRNICTNAEMEFTSESKQQVMEGLAKRYQEFSEAIRKNFEERAKFENLIVSIDSLKEMCDETKKYCNDNLIPVPKVTEPTNSQDNNMEDSQQCPESGNNGDVQMEGDNNCTQGATTASEVSQESDMKLD